MYVIYKCMMCCGKTIHKRDDSAGNLKCTRCNSVTTYSEPPLWPVALLSLFVICMLVLASYWKFIFGK